MSESQTDYTPWLYGTAGAAGATALGLGGALAHMLRNPSQIAEGAAARAAGGGGYNPPVTQAADVFRGTTPFGPSAPPPEAPRFGRAGYNAPLDSGNRAVQTMRDALNGTRATPATAAAPAGTEAAQSVRAAVANTSTLGSTLRGAAARVADSRLARGLGWAGLIGGTVGGLSDAVDENSALRRSMDEGFRGVGRAWDAGGVSGVGGAVAGTIGTLAQGALHAGNAVALRPFLSMVGAGRVADLVDRGVSYLGPGRDAPAAPAAAAAAAAGASLRGQAAQTPTYTGQGLPFPTAPRSAPGPNGEWNGPSDQDMLRVHNERVAQRAQAESLMALSPQQRGQLELARQMTAIPRPRQATGNDMAIAQALTLIEQDFQRQLAAATTPQERERVAQERIARVLGVARGPGMLPMANMYGPDDR